MRERQSAASWVRGLFVLAWFLPLAGCFPSDPGSSERLVVARGEDRVTFFVVGCGADGLMEHEAKLVIVVGSAPYMSSSGTFELDGSLDPSGEFVVRGDDFDLVANAVGDASDADQLRYYGVQTRAGRRDRLEFVVPITTFRQWLADKASGAYLYGNAPVNVLPPTAVEQRCGVSG